jgi:hypothetical protein
MVRPEVTAGVMCWWFDTWTVGMVTGVQPLPGVHHGIGSSLGSHKLQML